MNKNNRILKGVIIGVVYISIMLILYPLLIQFVPFQVYPFGIQIVYLFAVVVVFHSVLDFILQKDLSLTREKIVYLCYIVLLGITLYFRKTLNEMSISSDFYLKKWLPIVFKNPIVFFNLIGNIILYIPLGIFIQKQSLPILYKLILGAFIVLALEGIQYITKKGVFDYIDLLLNGLGVGIGYLLVIGKENIYVQEETKRKTDKETKKKIEYENLENQTPPSFQNIETEEDLVKVVEELSKKGGIISMKIVKNLALDYVVQLFINMILILSICGWFKILLTSHFYHFLILGFGFGTIDYWMKTWLFKYKPSWIVRSYGFLLTFISTFVMVGSCVLMHFVFDMDFGNAWALVGSFILFLIVRTAIVTYLRKWLIK